MNTKQTSKNIFKVYFCSVFKFNFHYNHHMNIKMQSLKGEPSVLKIEVETFQNLFEQIFKIS